MPEIFIVSHRKQLDPRGVEWQRVKDARPLTSPAPATLILLPGLDGTEVFFQPLIATLLVWVRPVVVTYPTAGANGYTDLLPLVEAAVAGVDNFYILG